MYAKIHHRPPVDKNNRTEHQGDWACATARTLSLCHKGDNRHSASRMGRIQPRSTGSGLPDETTTRTVHKSSGLQPMHPPGREFVVGITVAVFIECQSATVRKSPTCAEERETFSPRMSLPNGTVYFMHQTNINTLEIKRQSINTQMRDPQISYCLRTSLPRHFRNWDHLCLKSCPRTAIRLW